MSRHEMIKNKSNKITKLVPKSQIYVRLPSKQLGANLRAMKLSIRTLLIVKGSGHKHEMNRKL